MFKIKILHFLLFLFISFQSFAQNYSGKNWKLFKNEKTSDLKFTKTQNKKIRNFRFEAKWDEELSYSENLGHYGGIKLLDIYKNGKHIQTLKNIEDGIALGYIIFTFYDYNMDGYLDFTIPIDCGNSCYDAYYLYNPKAEKFEHFKEWDYLRIQKINQSKMQILSQLEGTARTGKKILYRVKEFNLNKIKVLNY